MQYPHLTTKHIYDLTYRFLRENTYNFSAVAAFTNSIRNTPYKDRTYIWKARLAAFITYNNIIKYTPESIYITTRLHMYKQNYSRDKVSFKHNPKLPPYGLDEGKIKLSR